MTVKADIHVGDIGSVFEPTLYDQTGAVLNVGPATVRRLLLKKPDGTVMSKPAVLSTDGHDGKMRYVTVDGDLDTPGAWSAQGYIEMDGGKWHSSIFKFTVVANLN